MLALVVWIVGAGATAPVSMPVQAPAPVSVDEALERVLGDPDYQRELPDLDSSGRFNPDDLEQLEAEGPSSPGREASPPPSGSERVRPGDGGRSRSGDSSSSAAAVLHPVVQAFGWTMIAVIVIVLIAWLATSVRGGPSREPEPAIPAATAKAGAAAAATPAPSAHEALALEGRFTEAIHALLVDALASLQARSRRSHGVSLTTRELAPRLELGESQETALSGLAGAVELALFGGRAAGRSEYERCLSLHVELLGPEPGGARA